MNAVRGFKEALGRARGCAPELDRILACTRVLTCTPAIDRALARPRDLATALDRNLDSTVFTALDRDPSCYNELDQALGLAIVITIDIVYGLDKARGLACDDFPDHDAACDLINVLDHGRLVALALRRDLVRAGRRLAPFLDKALQGDLAGRVTAPAKGLVAAASRLLPVADRVRYHAEFSGELWEIAVAGGGRCQQVRYAARQVISALPLRFAVWAPRRRKASL